MNALHDTVPSVRTFPVVGAGRQRPVFGDGLGQRGDQQVPVIGVGAVTPVERCRLQTVEGQIDARVQRELLACVRACAA